MSNESNEVEEVTTWSPVTAGSGSESVAGARSGGVGTCNLCDEIDGHTGQCPVIS